MKQKIKIHLWRTNSTVHMQVMEQENITKYLSESIRIGNYPELFRKMLHLRGNREVNNDLIVNRICDTEQQAINYINDIISWLDEVFPPKEPKRGDVVKVGRNKKSLCERIFIGYVDTAINPYLTVNNGEEEKFKAGEKFYIVPWEYMQPLTTNWDAETGIYEAEREV